MHDGNNFDKMQKRYCIINKLILLVICQVQRRRLLWGVRCPGRLGGREATVGRWRVGGGGCIRR